MANDNKYSSDISNDLGSMDAIYRPAFPSYKVFIYGHEVSADVMSVRVNQSGGSLERMPSTLSFTIANRYEKYTLTHEDMIYIGAYKKAVYQNTSPENINLSYSPEKFGYEYSNPIAGRPKFDKSGHLLSTMMGRSPAHPIGEYNISPTTMAELVNRLKNSSVEEARYTIEAFFSNIGGENGHKNTESNFRGLTSAQLDSLAAKLKSEADKGDFDGFEEWNEEELPFLIKRDVVEKKLDKKNRIVAASIPKYGKAVRATEGIIFRYPMQEGDFIFSLNDPVRVAYRDPFNPKGWYWMFTGFLDTWTENVGPNLDSTINVTCTDVTKMARYSLTRQPGYVDTNLDLALSSTNSTGSSAVADSNLVLTKEIFEGLTVLQIMELLFFGSESTIDSINASRLMYLNDLELIGSHSDEDEIRSNLFYFAVVTLNLSSEQCLEFLHNKPASDGSRGLADYKTQQLNLKNYLINEFGAAATDRASTLKWKSIENPGHVQFKRKDSSHGVDFRIYGAPPDIDDVADKPNNEYFKDADVARGATVLKDLHTWNELIHHRVKKSDLIDLATDVEEADLLFRDGIANFTIEQVIHMVGTDLDTYPVGNGKVYYCAPAGMTNLLGTGAVDRSFGGTESFHSVFKDRLTMLYDIADTLEWRFYATPKGDVVMEHPFYDFNPQSFFNSESLSTNLSDTNKNFFERYDKVFGQAYSGDYDDAESLTNMVFELNTNSQALAEFMEEPIFDYEKMFTVGIDEQISFSNTNTDKGLVTVARAKRRNFKLLDSVDPDAAKQFVYVQNVPLTGLLGFRLQDGSTREYITGKEGAEVYCAVRLNQTNAEARNVGLETTPKFGLMVNRPLLWRYRNYYCNIISCSHSITWNNDVSTSINVNSIRAWSGTIEDGGPEYHHFGGDRPFNWARLVYQSDKAVDEVNARRKQSQPQTSATTQAGETEASPVKTGQAVSKVEPVTTNPSITGEGV